MMKLGSRNDVIKRGHLTYWSYINFQSIFPLCRSLTATSLWPGPATPSPTASPASTFATIASASYATILSQRPDSSSWPILTWTLRPRRRRLMRTREKWDIVLIDLLSITRSYSFFFFHYRIQTMHYHTRVYVIFNPIRPSMVYCIWFCFNRCHFNGHSFFSD